MSRTPLPFAVGDISALAKSLKNQLDRHDGQPGHVELLNMLARSIGCRNYQDFLARQPVRDGGGRPGPGEPDEPLVLAEPGQPPRESAQLDELDQLGRPTERDSQAEPVDLTRVKRLLRHFDAKGRLIRWPSKQSQRLLCLWVLWAGLPPRQVMTEPGINQLINDGHLFGDHALLRRLLCDYGLVRRTPDGRAYQRVECRPEAQVMALFRLLRRDPPEASYPSSPGGLGLGEATD